MTSNRLFYWDACVFLSYVNGQPAERLENIGPMLHQASQGKLDIITSTLSIVEVAFGNREQNGFLHPETGEKIENLWRGPSKLVEFYSLIAQDARTLMRKALEQGNPPEVWKLKPMDAIHLASARRIEADEFNTYDSKLFKFESMTGLRICEPAAMQRQIPGVE